MSRILKMSLSLLSTMADGEKLNKVLILYLHLNGTMIYFIFFIFMLSRISKTRFFTLSSLFFLDEQQK